MKTQRRLGWFLVGVAVWNVVTWFMFARNLYDAHAGGEDRPQGYWIAHTGLIVVNLVLGGVFAALGLRILRRTA
jgi:putative solute:sodium symporter small subunit